MRGGERSWTMTKSYAGWRGRSRSPVTCRKVKNNERRDGCLDTGELVFGVDD